MSEVTIKNVRNAKYAFPDDTNTIDCEIETEEYGWIETTVIMNDGDPQDHVVALKKYLNDNKALIAPYVEPVLSLDELLELKTSYIEQERDESLALRNGNVTTPDGLVWQTDPTSMAELNNALTTFTALGGTPEGFVWRDANNVNHPASLQFLAGIAAARAVQVQSIWNRSWQLKAQLQAAYDAGDYDAMVDLTW